MPIPPQSVRNAAKKALDIRKELPPSRQAGTPVGVKRASDLARGADVSRSTIIRMRSYLLRAEKNYKDAVRQGKDIATSKAIQAYYLWGGPRALAWVRSILK